MRQSCRDQLNVRFTRQSYRDQCNTWKGCDICGVIFIAMFLILFYVMRMILITQLWCKMSNLSWILIWRYCLIQLSISYLFVCFLAVLNYLYLLNSNTTLDMVCCKIKHLQCLTYSTKKCKSWVAWQIPHLAWLHHNSKFLKFVKLLANV